jgi:hypothetical protein
MKICFLIPGYLEGECGVLNYWVVGSNEMSSVDNRNAQSVTDESHSQLRCLEIINIIWIRKAKNHVSLII